MKNSIVLHLNSTKNSMQASARMARFLSAELKIPLIDTPEALQRVKERVTSRKLTMFFVNGTPAFSPMVDNLGTDLFPLVQRVFWIQNDYTIMLPPHQGHSRPTNAVTPFRKNFFFIPEFHLWSTCKDILQKRRYKGNHPLDFYINWNALTYAPFESELETRHKALLYYGALRADRKPTFRRYLNSAAVRISASSKIGKVKDEWAEIAPSARLLPIKPHTPTVSSNGNTYGESSLLTFLDKYRHSLYMSDQKSLSGMHSFANRYYEVLSCPDTVLWLEKAGSPGYELNKLDSYEDFIIGSVKDLETRVRMPEADRQALAKFQRENWIGKDPYLKLVRRLHTLTDYIQS